MRAAALEVGRLRLDSLERSDDALFDTIFAGGYVMNRSNLMPPFGLTLTRDQIWSLLRYIRTLCVCEGPTWSRGQP